MDSIWGAGSVSDMCALGHMLHCVTDVVDRHCAACDCRRLSDLARPVYNPISFHSLIYKSHAAGGRAYLAASAGRSAALDRLDRCRIREP